MIINIIRASIIVLLVSVLGGTATYSLGFSYTSGMLLTLVLQIVAYNIAQYIRTGYVTVKLREIQLQELQSFENQGMSVSCSHCRSSVFVPIRFDQENSFECTECGNNNSIYINVTTAQETSNLDMNKITTKMLDVNEQQAREQILTRDEETDN